MAVVQHHTYCCMLHPRRRTLSLARARARQMTAMAGHGWPRDAVNKTSPRALRHVRCSRTYVSKPAPIDCTLLRTHDTYGHAIACHATRMQYCYVHEASPRQCTCHTCYNAAQRRTYVHMYKEPEVIGHNAATAVRGRLLVAGEGEADTLLLA